MPEAKLLTLKVRKLIATPDERYVEGLVYAPNEVDTWGEMMLPEDVKLMAHRYMRDVKLSGSIDTLHDESSNGSYPVASYLAKKNDPDGYPEGGWVLGVQITDDDLWEKVKKGEIAGYSFQALVTKKTVVATIEYYPNVVGTTESADGHSHIFVVETDDTGRIIKGITTTVNGHSHTILRGTATEESDGHSHRYFF